MRTRTAPPSAAAAVANHVMGTAQGRSSSQNVAPSRSSTETKATGFQRGGCGEGCGGCQGCADCGGSCGGCQVCEGGECGGCGLCVSASSQKLGRFTPRLKQVSVALPMHAQASLRAFGFGAGGGGGTLDLMASGGVVGMAVNGVSLVAEHLGPAPKRQCVGTGGTACCSATGQGNVTHSTRMPTPTPTPGCAGACGCGGMGGGCSCGGGCGRCRGEDGGAASMTAMSLSFDECGGHGDSKNRYHYHLPPICLLRSLGGAVPERADWWAQERPQEHILQSPLYCVLIALLIYWNSQCTRELN